MKTGRSGFGTVFTCAGVALCFLFASPVSLGAQAKDVLRSIRDTVAGASLFWEANPFLPNDQSKTIASASADIPDRVVPVIDVTDAPSVTVPAYVPPEVLLSPAPADIDAAVEIEYRNETSYTPDTEALLASAPTFSVPDSEPLVLILHTHTSEAYTPDSSHPYTPDDNGRTLDEDYNMVRIGAALTARLTDAGIGVIHSHEIHDYPSYTGSYSRSLSTAEAILAEYPSIKIVLDLHRDAILDENGVEHGTAVTVVRNGASLDTARLMLVVGTNEGGLRHPDWERNLGFALTLQTTLAEKYPGLMRQVNLRQERFNQHVTNGALLVEVGASGDTLSDALTAADLLADGLIDVLQG